MKNSGKLKPLQTNSKLFLWQLRKKENIIPYTDKGKVLGLILGRTVIKQNVLETQVRGKFH